MDKPFCLYNVTEHVDVAYLRTFQSVILQRESLVSECNTFLPLFHFRFPKAKNHSQYKENRSAENYRIPQQGML